MTSTINDNSIPQLLNDPLHQAINLYKTCSDDKIRFIVSAMKVPIIIFERWMRALMLSEDQQRRRCEVIAELVFAAISLYLNK